MRVTGQLTHTGIFSYRNPDGTERREYRPKEEVFAPSAVETFQGAPVTITHPAGGVTASSWKTVAIGHLGENIRQDGDHMVADLYVRDAAAVTRVKAGDLRHISCGYNVEYDPTPGTTPDGQRYDGIQRQIRGNHVAPPPARDGSPRGGAERTLRLDAAGDEVVSGPNLGVELTTALALVESLKGESLADGANRRQRPRVREGRTHQGAGASSPRCRSKSSPRAWTRWSRRAAKSSPRRRPPGVEPNGKTALQIKREIVANRTPAQATRTHAMGDDALDADHAVYSEQPSSLVGDDGGGDLGAGDARRLDGLGQGAEPLGALR